MQCESCNNYFRKNDEDPDRYLCYSCKPLTDDECSDVETTKHEIKEQTITNKSGFKTWSNYEDKTLIRLVKIHGEKWGQISKKMRHRNFLECKERWSQLVPKKATKTNSTLNPVEIKGNWTRQEDDILIKLAAKYGGKKWTLIANQLEGRRPKQCRERYINHLQPCLKKTPWTAQEDQIICQSHELLGNQWAKIARLLPGRSDNSVKNRWNATLSKKFEKKN